MKYLRQARDLVPDDPIIAEHLGDVYAVRQMYKKAIEQYRDALKNVKSKKDKRRIQQKLSKTSDILSDFPDY